MRSALQLAPAEWRECDVGRRIRARRAWRNWLRIVFENGVTCGWVLQV